MIKSGENREISVRTWYGEPQHEEVSGDGWETAYYGGSDEVESAGPLEFVPEVEHPGTFREDEGTRPPERPAGSLASSD